MKTILIVDDEPVNIRMIGEILKDKYVILVATNGIAAIDVAVRKKPDLILMDVVMPEMDGFSACKAVKNSDGCAGIPVVFVTSHDEEHKAAAAVEAGCDGYILKPFDPEKLLGIVDKLIGNTER